MTTIATIPLTKEQFDQRLSNLLGQLEDSSTNPYIDTHFLPTIGIGINLRVDENRNSVFNAMGIPESLRPALTAVINDTSIQTDAVLQQRLDAALNAPFVLTDAQVIATYTELVKNYVSTAKGKNNLPYSDELVALVSAQFNGLYGSGLQAALNLSDPSEARAEAWYQIRYDHKAELYKRRYAEAALFGLYDAGQVTDAEAKAIARMFTRHRDVMVPYDAANNGYIAEANLDLNAAGFNSSASNLPAELAGANYWGRSPIDFIVRQQSEQS